MSFFKRVKPKKMFRRESKSDSEPEPESESEYSFNYVCPLNWNIPPCVLPDEDTPEPGDSSEPKNLGIIGTDAVLYNLKEKSTDGNLKLHSMLKMPSELPGGNRLSTNTFNILMADVSGSMHEFWHPVETHWNKHVSPSLVGHTRIFTFDSDIQYRRSTTQLEGSDFSQGGTELTGALQTIVNEVYSCRQKFVNVFIITDGAHNGCRIQPSEVIQRMGVPQGKVCNVYVLGAGNYFPVQISIDLRSRLHSGSSNIPSLFWAKTSDEIEEQMKDIASRIMGGAALSMKLDIQGTSLPGLPMRDTFHLEEWVYFPHEAEKCKEINVSFGGNTAKLMPSPAEADLDILLNIFRQWNSVIIQQKYRQAYIPKDILPFMERLFNTLQNTEKPVGPKTLKERLEEKSLKKEEMEFRTLLNGVRSILTTEKFQNEIELAENILSTTVTRSKYETKSLQLKGHTDKEYEKDCEEFMKVYEANKEHILRLETLPEDLCQATKSSTLGDLKDEYFSQLMLKNKFDFLKNFTISGIPVFAPTRDSVTLNPWSFSVQRILNAPYTIMSQVAMETMVHDTSDKSSKEKEVHAKKDDDSTVFNAVVPVFPPSAAKVMRPIVRTRLYAMCVTFATLKNPHIIDFNVHMASLGVTWVRCLFDHPTSPRPEYVCMRMESIEATAALYLDRPAYVNYARYLKEDTPQALMTESTKEVEGKSIKCETLIKPMFILNLIQRSDSKLDMTKVAKIVEWILLEYVGRCLSHYKSKDGDDSPFTDFFAESLDDQEKKKWWVQNFVKDAKKDMVSFDEGLLQSFFTLEKVRKSASVIANEELDKHKGKMISKIPLKVNVDKVKQLRNLSSAGDVSWNTIQTFAREVGLGEDVIDTLFSEESTYIYTVHALKHRSSRERLQAKMESYEECEKLVKQKVQDENLRLVSKDLYDALIESITNVWLEEYLEAHSEVVEPMTRQQIVNLAQKKGIEVTEETFDKVYKKYRPHVGLLGNACQSKRCPYFLIPDKSYNQHASVERKSSKYPFIHSLHNTLYNCRDKDMNEAIQEITSGKNTKEKKPLPKEAVQQWASDIKKLKSIYYETGKSGPTN